MDSGMLDAALRPSHCRISLSSQEKTMAGGPETTLAHWANFPLIFPQFPPFSTFFVLVLGTSSCLKTSVLMLLLYWGYRIVGFSHTFTRFHTFFVHFHHNHSFLG